MSAPIHFVLIDAMNLIRRIYAVRENLLDCKTALAHSLNRLQEELEPTHAAIVFDGGDATWRHRLYPDYKLGRSPMPEELAQGLEGIRQQLRADGWFCIEQSGVEADDLIATLALRLRQKKLRVSIVSTDKVFAQLLPDEVAIRDHFNRRWLTVQAVQERYGVKPERLADYWAMTGDNCNHIPGVSGIGAKTSARLIAEWGSLEACLKAAADLGGKLGATLQQEWAQALLSRALIELRTDFDLGLLNLRAFRR